MLSVNQVIVVFHLIPPVTAAQRLNNVHVIVIAASCRKGITKKENMLKKKTSYDDERKVKMSMVTHCRRSKRSHHCCRRSHPGQNMRPRCSYSDHSRIAAGRNPPHAICNNIPFTIQRSQKRGRDLCTFYYQKNYFIYYIYCIINSALLYNINKKSQLECSYDMDSGITSLIHPM